MVYAFNFTKSRNEKVVASCYQTFIGNVNGYVTVNYSGQWCISFYFPEIDNLTKLFRAEGNFWSVTWFEDNVYPKDLL